MQQILFFFIRNKNFLLFVSLFAIAISLTIQSHSYHNGKFINSTNFLSGGIYSIRTDITKYFSLEEENDRLVKENIRLRKMLSGSNMDPMALEIDTSIVSSSYIFKTARVINNNYAKTKNNITLNGGSNDGIEIDMGVISSNGLVGIINHTSKNYATIQSILNTNSQINAKLYNSNQFGTLEWNTEDANVVQLIDVPRQAQIKIGDTIVTGGKSTIFPEGILIGTIEQFELGSDDSYDINIRLFNDMTDLDNVYIIKNKDATEIRNLENEADDVEQ